MAIIVYADEIKKTLFGYKPSQAELFHRESAKIADRKYSQAIKTCSEKTVILMSGGSASGKTEYISVYLRRRKVVIFDGTLPSFEGAKIKIEKALKLGKKVEVHAVLPKNFSAAFYVFLNRDRQFATDHYFQTHSGSRKTLLEIAQYFPNIKIKLIASGYNRLNKRAKMTFHDILYNNQKQLIEFLKNNQYTKVTIITHIIEGK